MGHLRLGVLPKTPRWRSVISQLSDINIPASEIADKVLDNAQEILEGESAQSCIGYCIWLISQITLSAKGNEFVTKLTDLGLQANAETSATELIARIARLSGKQLDNIRPHSVINNISSLAFRETLTKAIGLQANTLFGSQLGDVQISLRKYSTQKQFSNLLHIFFTSFLKRTLNYVLEKELSNQIGADKRFGSFYELERFNDDLEAFASQTSRIVDTFSGGWYSKKVWQEGAISEKDASGFVYVALKKLRSDLALTQTENSVGK